MWLHPIACLSCRFEMGRKRPNWRFNEAHVSEELKITVALALKKLMQNDDQKGEIFVLYI